MHALYKKVKRILLPLAVIAWIVCIAHTSCAQDDLWTLKIQANGQVIASYANVSWVYLGIAEDAVSYPSPGPPSLDYTVYMYLWGGLGGLKEDYRQAGLLKEVWGLTIRIEDRADVDLPGFFPELSWDPNDIGPASRMELRLNNEHGALLVEDMRTVARYQTKEEDAFFYFPQFDEARISYCIVFRPVAWFRDADGDGCGDPDDGVIVPEQPPGHVGDPCDCDDDDPTRYAGNTEACDGKDNDCDGIIPAEETTDADHDGYVACADCDDDDPNMNPMRGKTGESLLAFKNGKNVLFHFAPSCGPSTTFKILKDFKELGHIISMRYTTIPITPYYSTYWFFGRVCGKNIVINDDPWDGEVFIIDRSE